jgi:hypothetical protein
LLTREHSYTVARATRPNPEIGALISPLPYEDAMRRRALTSGCYIFADLDRLTPSGHRTAVRLHERISSDPRSTTLNDPSRSLTRLALLQLMEEKGINPFRARPLHQWEELRLPIFLREQDAHAGPLTEPLDSADAVKQTIKRLRLRGMTARHLIAVEYFDTADAAGRFRKFGAFRIGERIVPRHLFLSSNWLTKRSDLLEEETAKEELALVETNPHAETLKSIFEMAQIRYGRIDYSFNEDRLIVWEINPNPVLVPRPERLRAGPQLRAPARRMSVELLRDALEELDRSTKAPDPVQIPLHRSGSLIARVSLEVALEKVRRRWFSTASSVLGKLEP